MINTLIQLRIDPELYEHIQEVARENSHKQKKNISWRDVVRSTLEKQFFPLPEYSKKNGKKNEL